MTAVYVLRHPQTTWNVAERYQGRLDSPLSVEGFRQCRQTVDAFRRERVDAVFTSPLGRARALATALARGNGAALTIDHRLTEIAQGPWEGLYRAEISARYANLQRQWYDRPDLIRFPGGESLHDVRVRSQSALNRVFGEYPDGHVVVVAHAVVVQVIVAMALSLELRYLHRIHVANAGITTICGSSGPGSVTALNVTIHLHGSPIASAAAQGCAPLEPRRMAS